MSKINTLRIVNLNYNNNSIRISDEAFHLNGESTLLSLRNGGGKTVLVQMMTAPFVHKRYRDTKDRPFESYFTTNKPTFLLVEWVLDGGAGYVLTGMMVRKNQEMVEGEVSEELEIYNFISEYQERCEQDIFHLPIIEETGTGKKLKGWGACKKTLEDMKRESSHFFLYAMNQSAQSRMYFEKLKEYQINHKEWESIIKKVNLKESGLSELFADCRDEKGLVEKWFLDAVESKLNRDSNRMKEFRNIVIKYIRQYRKNQTNITRLETIRQFQELSGRLLGQCEMYLDITIRRKGYEQQIACFRQVLQELCQRAGESRQQLEERLEQLEGELSRISYEKYSYEIYQQEDEAEFYARDREQFVLEKEQIEREAQEIQREKNQVECARVRQEKKEALSECHLVESRLQVSRQDEREREPERRLVGSRLYGHYLCQQAETQKQLGQCREQLDKLVLEEKLWRERQEGYQQELTEHSARTGELRAQISAYDGVERNFCQKYDVLLERNILGEYEGEALEQEEQREKKLLQELETRFGDGVRERQETEEAIRKAEHDAESTKQELQDSRMVSREQEKLLADYEEELEQRRVILKYLELPESQLYRKERIEQDLQHKMEEIDGARRSLEREYEQMEQVCKSLRKGHLTELPSDFEEYLLDQEITPVYGMDWLSRNGRSKEENGELVKKQPFLPYSIILTAKDMKRLKKLEPTVYTNSPIPMLVREELEEAATLEDGCVYTVENIRFFLHFQKEILSPEGRERLLSLQQQQTEKKKHALEIKKEEYASYFSKLEQVRKQTVTDRKYQACQEGLEREERKQREYHQTISELEERKRQLQKRVRQLEAELLEMNQNRQQKKMMLEDFTRLVESYRAYLQDRCTLEKLGETLENLKRQIQMAKEKLEEVREEFIRTEREQLQQRSRKKLVMEKLAAFRTYKMEESAGDGILEAQGGALEQEELLELEARYEALTLGASQEIQILEEQLIRARSRFQQKNEELDMLLKRYDFIEEALEGVVYSRDTLFELEEQLLRKRRSQEQYEKKIHEKDTKLAVIQSKIEECYKRIEQTCGTRELVGREKITNLEFDGRSQLLVAEKRGLRQEAECLVHRLNNYQGNLDSLSEYEEFSFGEKKDVQNMLEKQNLGQMSESELNQFKGILLRDYKICQREELEARETVSDRLHEMARRETFGEEFFAKPIATMLELVGRADDLMKQLGITRDSYDSIIAKLEIDISVIEKEKEHILGLLTDYVKEIHENLGKIDKNSTISVRNRSVKMLTIRLPEWEENEEVYRLRVQELLEDVTKQGLSFLEENKNLEELTGIYINTNNLYDAVVGNGNIEIRLYKIEEQKEYPIRWFDVAKNSGGEGFLSAFIILTSLLYYMRKDDADIFADRNEGKVLVMDNPFAQTNAAHLLKPLMDMAKKTNTQLICLSGLGGDSIYNRFDNIYVLNLVAANLRAGTQYLQGEHLQGEEQDTMIAARFHVEQQTLLF